MIKLITLAAAVVLMTGCTDNEGAERVLRQNGYTDISITGYKPFTCSKDDVFSTGFSAKAPGGQTVTGSVCTGLFKSHTIRFD